MEDTSDGFYEDDEPVEKIRATFDAGVKGVTGRRAAWSGAFSSSLDCSESDQ
jgi:hypothetical protein